MWYSIPFRRTRNHILCRTIKIEQRQRPARSGCPTGQESSVGRRLRPRETASAAVDPAHPPTGNRANSRQRITFPPPTILFLSFSERGQYVQSAQGATRGVF